MMDATDRRIINHLQGGPPICDRPFAVAGGALGLDEDELLARLARLLADGVLTRFGPLYNPNRLGGSTVLAAMAVPEGAFDAVAQLVNAHPEVAHNYAREHRLNMWFVLASDDPERIDEVIAVIEEETGRPVYAMPKLDEFFIGLRLEA